VYNWIRGLIEKKGEQKPAFDIDIPFGAKDSELIEASYYIPEGFHAEIEGNNVVIKQGEQKPVGKVESNFKVGDWVIRELDNTCYQIKKCIINVTNNTYGYDLTNGGYISSQDANFYHIWTIQDAKDGDVLACDTNIIIYGGYINNYADRIGDKAILAYCGWNGEKLVLNKKKKEGFGGIGYVPATKEQRELLFSKMKEAGYEWDANHKQLKKIEQKPAWSEEDEEMLNSFLHKLEVCGLLSIKECIWIKNKLKALKQNTWKPSDEQMETLENVRKILHSNKEIYSKINHFMFNFEELIRTLKKLREE